MDKGACISFRGQRYETKPALIGYTVEISYDPANPEIITVSYPGFEPFQASPVKIGPYCDRQATLPAAMQGQVPTTSRFLDALETKYTQSKYQIGRCDFILPSYRKEARLMYESSLAWNIHRLSGMIPPEKLFEFQCFPGNSRPSGLCGGPPDVCCCNS